MKTIRVDIHCEHIHCQDVEELIREALDLAPTQVHIEDRTLPLSGDQERVVVFSYTCREYEGEDSPTKLYSRKKNTALTLGQFQELLLGWMQDHPDVVEEIDTVPDLFH